MNSKIIRDKIISVTNWEKAQILKTEKNGNLWWASTFHGEFPGEVGIVYEFTIVKAGQSWQLHGKSKMTELPYYEINCQFCNKEKKELDCFCFFDCLTKNCRKLIRSNTPFYCEQHCSEKKTQCDNCQQETELGLIL